VLLVVMVVVVVVVMMMMVVHLRLHLALVRIPMVTSLLD
jgi:hypothetical protein